MNTVALPIPRRSPLPATLAAALILAVGMGFGRFAFTGMYPLMVRHGELSLRAGSLAASANYVGYLIGALLLSLATPEQSTRLCRYALVGTVLCLAMLAWDGGMGFVLAVRLLAGALSAVTLIGASVWLFHVVNHPRGAPLLFAGVGIGIALSAELIALGNWLGASPSALWLALAGAGAILAALAWGELKPCPSATAVAPAETAHEPDTNDMLHPGPLVLIYGLAGFGYIVTATYLPLFV